MLQDIATLVKDARRVSTPLIAINTPDPEATIDLVCAAINGKAPKLRWDAIAGVVGINESGKIAAMKMVEDGAEDQLKAITSNPIEALDRALLLPSDSVLFVLNSHRYMEERELTQAIANLRSPFKGTGRTLILLSPGLTLPAELAQDVAVFDEPLPTDDELRTMLADLHTAAGLPDPAPETIERAVDALRGLAAFPAEQTAAMSLSKTGINLDTLWLRKRAAIEQTKGIKFSLGGSTFDQVGGLAALKELASDLFSGPCPPRVIIFVDEFEKSMAGAASDTSGVSQDFHKVILTAMEDNEWTGFIAVGPPGAGKSYFARAMGNTYNAPTIEIDLGAAKGSLVGQSEQSIRQIIKAIQGIAGPRGAYFIATCNKLDVLSPELLRRFHDGIYMFDLPSDEEKTGIWNICIERYSLTEQPIPDDTNWTGADIRTCCDLAWRRNITLERAATKFVPVAKSDPDAVSRLRKQASGKFLSASYDGPYCIDGPAPVVSRKIDLN